MAYIAKTDIEKYLNITLSTAGGNLVDSLIAGVDEYIDRETGRSWTKGANDEITEVFDGGVNKFVVSKPNIATIVSVEVDGQAVDSADIFNYGTYVKLDYTPAKANQIVEVVYKTSATALPADLKQAEIQWVSQMFKESGDAGKVTNSISTGPVSINFKSQYGPAPEFVTKVINSYKTFAI